MNLIITEWLRLLLTIVEFFFVKYEKVLTIMGLGNFFWDIYLRRVNSVQLYLRFERCRHSIFKRNLVSDNMIYNSTMNPLQVSKEQIEEIMHSYCF